MARRKKEDPEIHQDRIADAAGRMFLEKGIRSTTMDEIAKAAGYSKATLYVYFRDKEEIAAFLTWKSMKQFKETLAEAVGRDIPYKDRFIAAGFALYEYASKYPEYNQILLSPIKISRDNPEDDCYSRTYRIGEEINEILLGCFAEAKEKGAIRNREYTVTDVFHIWGMISGLVQIALQKQEYLKLACGKEPEEFLREGLEKTYSLLEAEPETEQRPEEGKESGK